MKEKTADELFEELGFSKLSEIENEIKTIYRNTKGKHIQFNHLVRRVSFEGSCRWIDMKELQAINKKVEELRMGKIVQIPKIICEECKKERSYKIVRL